MLQSYEFYFLLRMKMKEIFKRHTSLIYHCITQNCITYFMGRKVGLGAVRKTTSNTQTTVVYRRVQGAAR